MSFSVGSVGGEGSVRDVRLFLLLILFLPSLLGKAVSCGLFICDRVRSPSYVGRRRGVFRNPRSTFFHPCLFSPGLPFQVLGSFQP